MRCRSIPFMGTIVYRFWDSFKETVVQRLKAEVVNRAMPSLHEGHVKLRLQSLYFNVIWQLYIYCSY